jgi:8-oxo-dGTP pyrophosphatase MutT (NUDIX family)
MSSSPATVRIAAAALMRPDGATLLVRKRGTTAFMQPGGKIELKEPPVHALCRELAEELGISIAPSDAEYIGQYSAPAANEAGHIVVADLFRVETASIVNPAAEIEEVSWVVPEGPISLDLAPLTRDHVLPMVTSWAKQ